MHVQLKNMLKENKEKCKSTEDMKNDRSPEHDRYTNEFLNFQEQHLITLTNATIYSSSKLVHLTESD